jgi:hypothetical protein
VKTFNLKSMHATFLALAAGIALLSAAPSRAESSPTVQAQTPPAPVVAQDIRVAWDRVGSSDRTFA